MSTMSCDCQIHWRSSSVGMTVVQSTSSWHPLPGRQDMATLLAAFFWPPSACASRHPQRALDWISMRCFSTPVQPAPGISGDPRDMGVSQLDPQPESGAWKAPTSMGEPGGSPLSRRLSRLVTGEDTLLAKPPTPELLDHPELGKVI